MQHRFGENPESREIQARLNLESQSEVAAREPACARAAVQSTKLES